MIVLIILSFTFLVHADRYLPNSGTLWEYNNPTNWSDYELSGYFANDPVEVTILIDSWIEGCSAGWSDVYVDYPHWGWGSENVSLTAGSHMGLTFTECFPNGCGGDNSSSSKGCPQIQWTGRQLDTRNNLRHGYEFGWFYDTYYFNYYDFFDNFIYPHNYLILLSMKIDECNDCVFTETKCEEEKTTHGISSCSRKPGDDLLVSIVVSHDEDTVTQMWQSRPKVGIRSDRYETYAFKMHGSDQWRRYRRKCAFYHTTGEKYVEGHCLLNTTDTCSTSPPAGATAVGCDESIIGEPGFTCCRGPNPLPYENMGYDFEVFTIGIVIETSDRLGGNTNNAYIETLAMVPFTPCKNEDEGCLSDPGNEVCDVTEQKCSCVNSGPFSVGPTSNQMCKDVRLTSGEESFDKLNCRYCATQRMNKVYLDGLFGVAPNDGGSCVNDTCVCEPTHYHESVASGQENCKPLDVGCAPKPPNPNDPDPDCVTNVGSSECPGVECRYDYVEDEAVCMCVNGYIHGPSPSPTGSDCILPPATNCSGTCIPCAFCGPSGACECESALDEIVETSPGEFRCKKKCPQNCADGNRVCNYDTQLCQCESGLLPNVATGEPSFCYNCTDCTDPLQTCSPQKGEMTTGINAKCLCKYDATKPLTDCPPKPTSGGKKVDNAAKQCDPPCDIASEICHSQVVPPVCKCKDSSFTLKDGKCVSLTEECEAKGNYTFVSGECLCRVGFVLYEKTAQCLLRSDWEKLTEVKEDSEFYNWFLENVLYTVLIGVGICLLCVALIVGAAVCLCMSKRKKKTAHVGGDMSSFKASRSRSQSRGRSESRTHLRRPTNADRRSRVASRNIHRTDSKFANDVGSEEPLTGYSQGPGLDLDYGETGGAGFPQGRDINYQAF